jgi:hypothetical protein
MTLDPKPAAGVLPRNKQLWPCPTCGKQIKDHTEEGELARHYLIATLKSVLGEGIGWRIPGIVDDEVLCEGESR